MGKNLAHDFLDHEDDDDNFDRFTNFEKFDRADKDTTEPETATDADKLKRKKKLNHQKRGIRPDKGA